MSWHIKIAGPFARKDALKARVAAESMPEKVKAEITRRIDNLGEEHAYNPHKDTLAILVESYGHLDLDTDNPYKNCGTLAINVQALPYLDTPLAAVA